MAQSSRVRTVQSYRGSLSKFRSPYNYQPALTPHLDRLANKPFSQETVNEIVLWKVNRYVRLTASERKSLYALRSLRPTQHRQAERILRHLLRCDGVDLPMASTLMRFQNPRVFQIIDRHAYRAVFGKRYPLHPWTPDETKVSVYFTYVDTLHDLALSTGVSFFELDRILYMFDKQLNGAL